MKIKTIIVSMLAVAALASCTKEKGGEIDPPVDATAAYLSIRIDAKKETRSSDEDAGLPEESALKSLYLLTFDNNGTIVGVPGTTNYFIKIDPASASPDAVKVSASATKLLVIANPGTELLKVITNVRATSAFHAINAAIRNVTETELLDASKGFAMINCGDETGKAVGQKITDPLISLTGKIKVMSESLSEADAKIAAEADRVDMKIERLASKVAFKLKSTITAPKGKFTFGNWTVDAVNTEFYPFAEKTILSVTHTAANKFYVNNFYTQDPNFSGTVGAGLAKVVVDGSTYEPELLPSYGWMTATSTGSKLAYCIENTMDAPYQQYGNATRIVIKGTYYPTDVAKTTGDWFSFGGTYFKDLATLKQAYAEAAVLTDSPLRDACDAFYGKVHAYLTANGKDVTGLTGFADLSEANLANVANGGQVVKNGTTPVIRWFQNGLNYWYYEIRHDNESTTDMSFGKYGVVRNNWYSLTLGNVDGEGTPWYPEIDKPGPGDPDPKDPIDESKGYLGISVKVAPWVIWENEISI